MEILTIHESIWKCIRQCSSGRKPKRRFQINNSVFFTSAAVLKEWKMGEQEGHLWCFLLLCGHHYFLFTHRREKEVHLSSSSSHFVNQSLESLERMLLQHQAPLGFQLTHLVVLSKYKFFTLSKLLGLCCFENNESSIDMQT